MTTTEILERLDRDAKNLQRVKEFIVRNKEKLDALGFDIGNYFGGIDFDMLTHSEIVRVIQAFPGTWEKRPSAAATADPRIDYSTTYDGLKLRCWAGQPPPNCKIVEETVEVPAQPATKKTGRKLVCTEAKEP